MSEVRKAQIKLNMAKAKERHKTQLKSMSDRLKNVSSPKPMAELNKYTLARYQMKAAPDLATRSMDQGSGIEGMRTAANRKKIINRSVGIGKAAHKLTQKTNEDVSLKKVAGELEAASKKHLKQAQKVKSHVDKMEESKHKAGEVVQGSAFQDPEDRPKKKGRAKRFYNAGTKKAMASAGMAVIKNREKEAEAEADRQKQKAAERVVGAQSDKRKAAGKKLTDPKTGMEVGKTKQDTKKEIAKAIKPTTKVTVLPTKMPRRRKLRLTSGDEIIFDSEDEMLMEDGHQDVASARRKAVLIMEDAAQLLMKLKNMDPMDSLPSWWMNKMSVTAAYMDSMRNYLLVPSMGMEDPDMGTMPESYSMPSSDTNVADKYRKKVIPQQVTEKKKKKKKELKPMGPTSFGFGSYDTTGNGGMGEESDKEKMKNIDDIMKMYKNRKPLSATVKMGQGMKRLKSKLDAIPSTDKAGRVSRSRIQKKFGSNVLQN